MNDRKKTWWRDPFFLLTLVLVLLLMGLIFSFSAQPVAQSSKASDGFVLPLLHWLFPDFSGFSSERQAKIAHILTLVVRKSAHLLEFAALGFALRLHVYAVERWRRVRRAGLLAWAIGTLYGASDELHQLLVPGRGPRLYDVGVDSLGVLLGVLFVLTLSLVKKHFFVDNEGKDS